MEWRNVRKRKIKDPGTEAAAPEVIGHRVQPGGPVIASAVLVKPASLRRRAAANSPDAWQAQAWELYDDVSELRFGVTWLANAVSRARLFIGKIDPDGTDDPQPVEDDTGLIEPLLELAGGQTGQAEMLHRMAIHLSIPGETYLIGWNDPEAEGNRRWITATRDEFTVSAGGQLRVRRPETDEQITMALTDAVVIRLWRPHPRRAWWSDSPVRALRGPLRELLGVSSHIGATIDSRLAGAGVLVLPDSATLPQPQESDGTVNPIHSDPFVAALVESMVTPINDRDTAAAVVPIVVRVPETAAGAVKHLAFSTPFDAKVLETRSAAIRRVATGLDIPAEVLEGVGDLNHWGSWMIDESAVKLHIKPLLALICAALTEQYLRPAYKAAGRADADDYMLWFDAHSLTLRPNRGPEAIELWDKGLLSDDATRRENGFADTDAPAPKERRRNTAFQLALNNPQIAPYLLPLLDIDVEIPDPAAVQEAEAQARLEAGQAQEEGREVSDGGRTGRNELPAAPDAERPAAAQGRPTVPRQRRPVTAAAPGASAAVWRLRALEIASLRALERAGNWLLHRSGRAARGQFSNTPLHELHTLVTASPDDLDNMLAGAYRELHHTLPADECLHQAVDYYVRSLIIAGEPHQRRHLEAALKQARCPDAA